jgi:hypothetical protein
VSRESRVTSFEIQVRPAANARREANESRNHQKSAS